MDATTIATDLAADALPRDHKTPRRHVIQAHDGRAEVWLHPGNAELPPSVFVEQIEDVLPDAVTTLEWSPAAARALAHALLAVADAADAL